MKTVLWKVHLRSNPERVFTFFTSPNGRERFWAEKAPELDGIIYFQFPNGQRYNSKILQIIPNRVFHIDYFNSSLLIVLAPSENSGTDLTLINQEIEDSECFDVHAGWVSVLMNLKATVDFKCDLRNHNKNRTWDQKYIDN